MRKRPSRDPNRVQTEPAMGLEALLERSRKLIDYEERDESMHTSLINPARQERIKKYLNNKPKLVDVRDVVGLMNFGEHIPKLHVVVNYGDQTVLPQVVEVCNKEQQYVLPQLNPEVEPKKTVTPRPLNDSLHNRVQSETISPSPRGKKSDLLKECSRENSYVTYKKNRRSIFNHQTSGKSQKLPRRIRMPNELQHLKSMLFPRINMKSSNLSMIATPREEDIRTFLTEDNSASRIIESTKTVMREDSPIKDFLKESRRQQARLDEIGSNLNEAIRNGFPPILLASVLRHLNESERAVHQQMQDDIVKEEKKELYKKFDRMLQNERLTYQSHIRHILDYKRRKIRDEL